MRAKAMSVTCFLSCNNLVEHQKPCVPLPTRDNWKFLKRMYPVICIWLTISVKGVIINKYLHSTIFSRRVA